jgi:4-amino-4-deoxy-L-arabinose transferase-like glycosyltransferase
VVFLCFFAGLDTFGLVGPDEPRYASIAREMARSGDWVTPRLNGQPWFEKPPLYYWSAAIGFRVFDSPEKAARAPSGVFGVCALLAMALAARRFFGPGAAFTLTWMLPATVGMTGFAHAAATDMPFAACLALAMAAAAPLLLDTLPANQRAWAAGFGAALGLATLAKGPAAVALAGGSVALWAAATGNIRRSFRLLHPLALASFFVIALPWYVLCTLRNPQFLRIFLLEHNVERFLTNRYQHHQPFWFFVPILLLAIFPWTLLLIPAARDAWHALRANTWRSFPASFFAAWVIFPMVFFSASQSKLPGYILPSLPPLVLLLAQSLSRRSVSTPAAARLWILSVGLALTALGAAALFVLHFFPQRLSPAVLAAGGAARSGLALAAEVLVFGGLFAAARSDSGRMTRGATIIATVFAIASGVALLRLLRPLDAQISPRAAAVLAGSLVGDRGELAAYQLKRGWQYGLEFYLQRSLAEWSPGGPAPSWVVTSDAGFAELERRGVRTSSVARVSSQATIVRTR